MKQKVKKKVNMMTLIKKSYLVCNQWYDKLFATVFLMSISAVSFADSGGLIPTSSDDQTSSNSNFGVTIVRIFQKDILPIIMLSGAVWAIWEAISTIAEGLKESKETKKMGPLKEAIIKSVIIVVVGGALIYLLERIRNYKFN